MTPGADSLLENCVAEHHPCAEQTDVLKLVAQGHNVFYTGAAGTGKSTVLRAMVQYLHAHSRDRVIETISSTGITALNIGCRTIHSFAKWGLTVDEKSAKKVRTDAGRQRVWETLHELEVLIVDEISMMCSKTLTRLESVLQHVMKNTVPFGGVQMIIAGDFFQLPPVKPFNKCHECGMQTQQQKDKPKQWERPKHAIYHDDDKWAFRSQVWDDLSLRCKQLVQIHRQFDPTFTAFLNKYRVGTQLMVAEDNLLWEHISHVGDDAIRIYPRRGTVDDLNAARLAKLKGIVYTLPCVDSCHWNGNEDDHKRYELAKRWRRVEPGNDVSPFQAWTLDRHRYDEAF